jgi:hypothetical protein
MRTWTAIAVTVALATGCGNDGDGTQTGSAGATTTGTAGESTGGTTAASTAEPTTGSSGEATTGTGGTTDATTGTTDATTGTMTTATTGPACISCSESFMGVDGELCPASKMLNDAVFACVCTEACADVCEGACTMGQAPDMTCQTCQSGAIQTQCAREFMACLNDK